MACSAGSRRTLYELRVTFAASAAQGLQVGAVCEVQEPHVSLGGAALVRDLRPGELSKGWDCRASQAQKSYKRSHPPGRAFVAAARPGRKANDISKRACDTIQLQISPMCAYSSWGHRLLAQACIDVWRSIAMWRHTYWRL